MANSRKSRSLNKEGGVAAAYERALGAILARVAISGPALRIGIAFSGGLDSSVLLHLASRHAVAHNLALTAFHVHHGLSPNADAWMAHCASEASASGVSMLTRNVTVSDNTGRGVEEAARIARYRALGELCREAGCTLLLTAHHQDDQAETVLLQLLRGAGLPGLSGMAQFQASYDLLGDAVALGRPLLGLRRTELEEFGRQAGVNHVTDESNADARYRRNALRQDVAPLLERHFPGFAPLVARSAGHVQSAQALLQELAEIDLAACRGADWSAPLYVPALQTLSAQRADNLLRHWLYRNRVQLPSASRLEEIRSQMLGAAGDMHPFFDFGPMTLRRIASRLELHPRFGTPPDAPVALPWQGEAEVPVPAWRGRLVLEPTDGLGISQEELRRHPLMLHPRGGQERLKLAANRPSRSLKALYQEADIPPWRRLWSPLLYLNGELVFVAGLGMDVRHAVMGNAVLLRWESD
ncbi:tRNA lysidine(34) synthetase TilS|uniref:tRNA lysidine(34) synthetase TilS n=1 Tax=Noviherbaspirillum sp. L7-7A TaxID=2850560 RepID=UPI001C2C83AD|nr:tRNA lysidine(34) synthetase TilS [Noviherbaspirillum sp. L7-7A]MBV0878948.1 tRNA lysidine(34) synthetase TilS [Noviherbaspirillum sp. L7-7A]